MAQVAELLGVGLKEAVRKWCRQVEVDAGAGRGASSEDYAELKRLKRENAELRRANAILRPGAVADGQDGRPGVVSEGVVGCWCPRLACQASR